MGPKLSRSNLRAALALLGAVLLSACGADFDPGSNTEMEVASSTGNSAQRGFIANFDLTKGLLPTANNLLFSGSQDGTLNIPVAPTDPTKPLKDTLNTLDGFSTVAPLSTTFSVAVNASTLGPSTVRMFEVTVDPVPAKNRAVTGVTRALAFGGEFAAMLSSVDATGKTVAIIPLRALKPKTTYMVALFKGIQSSDGRPVLPADHYLTAKTVPHDLTGTPAGSLEPVRKLVQAQEAALAAFGVDPEPVVLSWTFTTQSAGDVLAVVRSRVPAAPATALAATGASTPLGAADIYAGTLEVPYYLAAATGANDPTPLQTTWRALNEVGGERNLTQFNPLPETRSTQAVPLLLTVPKLGSAPWPVVVFQHGITSNRTAR